MIPRLFQISFLFLFTLLTGCEATSITIESTSPPLEVQHQLEQDWLIEFDAGNYTIENPYLLKDPYQNSPLSYLLMFKTEEEAIVSYKWSVTPHNYHLLTPPPLQQKSTFLF